jgi:hypothetical protein
LCDIVQNKHLKKDRNGWLFLYEFGKFTVPNQFNEKQLQDRDAIRKLTAAIERGTKVAKRRAAGGTSAIRDLFALFSVQFFNQGKWVSCLLDSAHFRIAAVPGSFYGFHSL